MPFDLDENGQPLVARGGDVVVVGGMEQSRCASWRCLPMFAHHGAATRNRRARLAGMRRHDGDHRYAKPSPMLSQRRISPAGRMAGTFTLDMPSGDVFLQQLAEVGGILGRAGLHVAEFHGGQQAGAQAGVGFFHEGGEDRVRRAAAWGARGRRR